MKLLYEKPEVKVRSLMGNIVTLSEAEGMEKEWDFDDDE